MSRLAGSVSATVSLTIVVLLTACWDAPPQGATCGDATAPSVSVALDSSISSTQTATGYLVPLTVRATIPCLEGVAHATVVSSAGQFAPVSVSPPGTPASTPEAGTDAGDGSAEGGMPTNGGGAGLPDAGAASGGASTTLTLTPDGAGNYLGFTTLLLSGLQITARLQVLLGDAASCETLSAPADAGPSSVQITHSKTCAQ